MSHKIEELRLKEEALKAEIEDFKKEKERVRQVVGSIGGANFSKRDMIINAVFLIVILVLFVMELTTHFLPTYVSLEVSILLVSVKIVWMIHSQHKVNHFQFWILSSIEFRINEVVKNMKKIESEIKNLEKESA